MVWPFSRKPARNTNDEPTATAGPRAPRAAGADQALVTEILAWLAQHASAHAARQEDGAVIHLGHAGGEAPAGAVLKVKRGKLAWVDLYDPALREPINALIKHLDRQQKWSFNGVVSTKHA